MKREESSQWENNSRQTNIWWLIVERSEAKISSDTRFHWYVFCLIMFVMTEMVQRNCRFCPSCLAKIFSVAHRRTDVRSFLLFHILSVVVCILPRLAPLCLFYLVSIFLQYDIISFKLGYADYCLFESWTSGRSLVSLISISFPLKHDK